MDHLGNAVPTTQPPPELPFTPSSTPSSRNFPEQLGEPPIWVTLKRNIGLSIAGSVLTPVMGHIFQALFPKKQAKGTETSMTFLGLYLIAQPTTFFQNYPACKACVKKYATLPIHTEIKDSLPGLKLEFHTLLQQASVHFDDDTPLSRSLRIAMGSLGAVILLCARVSQQVINRCYINITLNFMQYDLPRAFAQKRKEKQLSKTQKGGPLFGEHPQQAEDLSAPQAPSKRPETKTPSAPPRTKTKMVKEVLKQVLSEHQKILVDASGPWIYVSLCLQGMIHLTRCFMGLTTLLPAHQAEKIKNQLSKRALINVFNASPVMLLVQIACWEATIIMLFIMLTLLPPLIFLSGVLLFTIETLASYQLPKSATPAELIQ